MKINYKKLVFFFADIIIIVCAYWVAAFLRHEGNIPAEDIRSLIIHTAIAMIATVFFSVVFGCYGSLWQYAGVEVMFRQVVMAALSSGVLLIIKYTFVGGMSGSISVIYGIVLFVMTSGVRTASRSVSWLRSLYSSKSVKDRQAVIIGAGNTGAMLIKRSLDAQHGESFYPVAVIDNDPKKIGMKLCGVKVVGNIDSVENVCKKYQAKEIIVALPGATKEDLYDIYRKCIKTNLPIKSSQNFLDVKDYLQEKKVALKNITLEDLLFRDAIENDMTVVREFIQGRVVMVTGGAGSIGSELGKQALQMGCKQLIIYDLSEIGLYEIDEGLNENFAGFDKSKYKLCLGSVRDEHRLRQVIQEYNPYVVFHAAAHKHVPMMELNPFEAIKNNVEGTLNVIDACINNNVKKFILISTDKAVNTVNIMGASKRLAELIVKFKSQNCGETELAAVRFGNVLGSKGSVIHKFKRQIAAGGPVTLTDKSMIRYFMTIPEAVGLVLTAGAYAKGGDIFVLDMGRPVKIYDLAADLIRMSGYEPDVDIKIEVTGFRPGEKLFEELFFGGETIDKTSHDKIFILKSGNNSENFYLRLNEIIKIAEDGKDEELLREKVFEMAKEI